MGSYSRSASLVSSSQNNIRDVTDSLIEQCVEKKAEANGATQIPNEKIINLVNDIFGAGTSSQCSLSSLQLVSGSSLLLVRPQVARLVEGGAY